MNTTLYYFSGTGNSYYVAKELQKRFAGSTLLPITAYLAQKEVVSASEKVGFIFPMYFQGMPKIVLEFLRKVRFEDNAYIFAVVTRGGGGYQGGALGQFKRVLHAKKQQLSAGFYISMPENYLPLLKTQPPEKQQTLFQSADEKISAIAKQIDANTYTIETEVLGFARDLAHKPFLKKLDRLHQKFEVSAQCNSCGLCEKVCPVNNISMHTEKPTWHENCQCCLACMHYCPKQAIELGKSKKKARYHHPSVPIDVYLAIKPKN